ncbi:hypothetical protein GGI43DRAFT_388489 [Trichoderma evansii]
MTRVKPGERKRTRAPKVRTGCGTCKSLTPPFEAAFSKSPNLDLAGFWRPHAKIVQGTSTGRTCDGYDEAIANQAIQIPPVAQPLKIQIDSLEIRSIEFFVEKSRMEFSSLFQDEWWKSQILQLAYAEASIRHALVALSMHHEQFTNRRAEIELQFAKRQQNLAIRELLLPNQRSLTYLHPMTCFIFICIEILQGNHEAGIRFFMHGYKMLRELQQQRANRASTYESDIGTSLRYLETSFNKLAVQVELLVGDVSPELSMTLLGSMASKPSSTKRPIHSLSDAQHTLTSLIIYSMQSVLGNFERRQYARGCITNWLDSFHEFNNRQRDTIHSGVEGRGPAVLELQAKLLLLNLDMAGGETVEEALLNQDRYVERFQEIVQNASSAIAEKATEENPLFHLELGVVPVLFSVIAHCRHPVIRRQALHLLKTMHVQEGVWSSDLTSRVAERLMELEEAGQPIQQPGDIPISQRITSVAVHMEENQKRANVIYTGQGRERSEMIKW